MASVRLAWFSPMPPVRSGVAACSAELVAALRREHQIDVFVDEPVAAAAAGDSDPDRPRSAHEFVWRHRQAPYDLTVFQLGNSSHHDYIWPYLFRFPGLAVLHDAHLHHARAASLLRQRRTADYRAEFAANHPDSPIDAAELAVAGFDSSLLYEWPLTRLVVAASRMTAVHSRLVRDQIRGEQPDAAVEHVRLGHGTLVAPAEVASRRRAARQRYAIPEDAIVFGCFGGLSPDKRIPQILDALDAVLPYVPGAQLLLGGSPAEHYDARGDAASRGAADRIVHAGYIDSDAALTDGIAACDVTLNLRWPTAREVSGPWLRSLAAGRASIVVDLAHLADLPTVDPRTWASSAPGVAPVAVAIDVLDEDHSLRLAMRRLGSDAALRDALGRAARDFWIEQHSPAAMLDDYRRLLPRAAALPVPRAELPPHLRADESGRVEDILSHLGVAAPWSKI
jgi:glycosyltransferase involved in cell wall biosynthesis